MTIAPADLTAWRTLIERARGVGRTAFAGRKALNAAVKRAGGAASPSGHHHKFSPFYRLYSACRYLASVGPDQRKARELEIRTLAEECAEALGDPFDHAVAEAAPRAVRPRADVDA